MKTLTVLLVMIYFVGTSQVSRNTYIDGSKIETVMFSTETMFFKSKYNKKDTVFIGIMADSITPHVVSLKLYAFMPKEEINLHSGILVFFMDGDTEWLPITYKDKENKYVEYGFSQMTYKKIAKKRVSSILIGACNYFKKEYETYFIDFLRLI